MVRSTNLFRVSGDGPYTGLADREDPTTSLAGCILRS
jgi:hypothetical protein